MEVLIPFSSLPSFCRNSLVIGKRRNAASTSTRSCHISKAWSQITTGRRSCRSDGVLPWTGWDGTGPKASARTQRLSSRVLESLRHFSLYFSRQWIPGIKREVHHLLSISFWQKKNPDSRSTHDRKSPFSRYLWLSLERLDLVLLYKTRVTWHSEKAKTCVSSHLILFCLFAFFDFVFHLSELREDVLNLYIYIVLNWWYNQSWGENRRYLSLYVFNMQLILQTKSHVDTFTRLLSFVQTSQEKPYHWLEAILLQDWTIIS